MPVTTTSLPAPVSAAADDGPCQSCGACCAAYRVSFYWAEAESRGLPPALVRQRDPWNACLAGTDRPAPHTRCEALAGTLGESVRCTVYAARPEPCRLVMPGDDQCRRARARHGLAPLPATA
jgi:Fe-S-cluster containining protein